ncbi:SET domain protein [Dictyocaulus viviparus]|uniref:SET domain protein n=1 Tax=Dictyocaulus viviparus TaxID=29172 RepID=A0A0D8XI82_DICVI|nr:SET domain protein [Dictyocaulus viviparus]
MIQKYKQKIASEYKTDGDTEKIMELPRNPFTNCTHITYKEDRVAPDIRRRGQPPKSFQNYTGYSKHKVFRTCDGRGWAVRALRDIQRGSFIGEYTGELISDTEMARSDRTDTYFFETRVGEKLYTVDARRYGNFTRFINHSCRPNARVGMVIWEAQPEQLCHICIFASENISKGEEITISYGKSWWEAKRHQKNH